MEIQFDKRGPFWAKYRAEYMLAMNMMIIAKEVIEDSFGYQNVTPENTIPMATALMQIHVLRK